MSSFPERLKKLRTEHKMTQEELGQKINVTKVSVSGYENGTRKPDMETLQKIADIFGVSVDYLLGRTNDPNQHLISAPYGTGKTGFIREQIKQLGLDKDSDGLTPEELEQLDKLKHEEVAFKDFLEDPIEAKREFLQAYQLFKEMKKKRDSNNK